MYLFECLFSIILSIYAEVILLDQMLILCLTFRGNSTLFSTAAIPLYIPTSNAQGFQLLHIFSNACHFCFFFFLIFKFIYLFIFIFGCVGSSFLCKGFL